MRVFIWFGIRMVTGTGRCRSDSQSEPAKAELLYGYIDSSDFYANPIAKENRSIMNVPFTLANPELEKQFLQEAKENHLLNLAGHRSVGGMRSIYNAVPLEGVQALVNFMDDFAKRNA